MSPRALAATLPKLTKPVLERHGRAYATLIAEWTAIAGPALAAMSLPEKLAPGPPSAGGTLTIRVAGAAATELQHLAPQIIDRINTCLGFGAVARLKVLQGPLPGRAQHRARRHAPVASPEAKAEIATATAAIADEPLRAALTRLGEAVIAESAPPAAGPSRLRRHGKTL
jgi:hypothetical protein